MAYDLLTEMPQPGTLQEVALLMVYEARQASTLYQTKLGLLTERKDQQELFGKLVDLMFPWHRIQERTQRLTQHQVLVHALEEGTLVLQGGPQETGHARRRT